MGLNSQQSGILYIGEPTRAELRSLRKYVPLDYFIDVAGTSGQVQTLLARKSPALVVFGDALQPESRTEMLQCVLEARQTVPCVFLTDTGDLAQVASILANGRRAEREATELRSLLNDETWASVLHEVVAAVDARDPQNVHHSRRVSETSEQLGRVLGLSDGELELLKLAALLHDIGKMRVPEEILSKPGKLDRAEWEIMQQHPIHGAEIVSRVDRMAAVAKIIRHHHERVDGQGYPDRLRGDEIPLLSRLLSVVDAYQAMTSDRSYRTAMPPSEARALIEASLGTQFDPEIGGAFLGLVPA